MMPCMSGYWKAIVIRSSNKSSTPSASEETPAHGPGKYYFYLSPLSESTEQVVIPKSHLLGKGLKRSIIKTLSVPMSNCILEPSM